MLLGKIGKVRAGLVLSRKKSMDEKTVKQTKHVLNIKNIESNGTFGNAEYETFEAKEVIEDQYISKQGDIVMRLSYPYTVVLIDETHEGLVIPSHFAIIDVETQEVLPEYLAWYLNQERVKQELKSRQSGTSNLTTNKKVLESLDIQVLSQKRQEELIQLYAVFLEEQRLLLQMIAYKQTYYEKVVAEVLRREAKCQ
ncbi:MAG: hypothetical protein ACRC1P_11225 [Cellulosilyticaceae bacterium]